MSKKKLGMRHTGVVPETWHSRLDAAVMAHFPEVLCESSKDMFTSHWQTKWSLKNGGKVRLSLDKRIKAFVAGFMTAEEWYS